ncbi:MAG: glycosyltransferase family 4 protein [Anaerolineales bacterium]
MRIGFMTDVYKPHVSGITNYITLGKRYLESQGHQVFVFTFGGLDYPDDETNIIRSPGLPLADTGMYINVRYANKAARLLYTMDVVHVHHPFLSGRLAMWYCKPRGIPIVFTNHTRYDLYSHIYLPALPEPVSETLLKAYMPSFCKQCNLVTTSSNGMRDIMRKLQVDTPIEVIPNYVDLAHFEQAIAPIPRETIGWDDSRIVLIYTGRLGPEKNLPFLLRAFKGVAEANPRVCLLLVGDGPERENLEDRVRYMGLTQRVHFTGMVPFDEIVRYLKMADAFVTASVTEVHPLSVIEAMAASLPVLGINSPGVGDSVEDGVTGFLASEEDLPTFTAKMMRLTSEGGLRCEMGNRAREVAKQYSVEHIGKIMLEHYQTLAQRARPRRQTLRARWLQLVDRLR